MPRLKTFTERLKKYGPGKAIELDNQSHYKRYSRIKKKVNEILTYDYTYFITFTLHDKGLKRDKEYLIRKIKEAIGSASLYIANEDYGSERGRLHFHALACFNEQLDYTIPDNYVNEKWKYGTVDFKPIHTKNDAAITKYLTKLTNHTVKETAKRIIYSRGFTK